MKIGLFTDTFTPDINGVVTTLQMMMRELPRQGHDVYLFCPRHTGTDISKPGIFEFPSFKFIFYRGIRLALPYSRSAFRLLPKLDIIHSHDPGPMGMLAMWASSRYHIPHIHTYHDLYIDYRRYIPRVVRPTRNMVKSLSQSLCNRCDAVIAPSFQMKYELESYGITCPIYALPFGVDEEEFSQNIEYTVKTGLGLGDKETLLYAGRLGAEKNLDFLLRSFKKILLRRPAARLILAGDGPHRHALEAYAATLGISPCVTFTGFLDRGKLIDLYKQTVFVFASKTDTQGLVVVEAMMAGAAVIAVKAMGPIDLIRSGETGILVEEDENVFAQACCQILENPGTRQKLGAAARDWARSQNSKVSTSKLVEIYRTALAGSLTHSENLS